MALSKDCFRKLGFITTLLIALHLGLAPTLRSDAQPALSIQTAADGTQTAVANGKQVGTIEILKCRHPCLSLGASSQHREMGAGRSRSGRRSRGSYEEP
ncbi:MAG TPA: hypothetical protein VJB59_05790 [Bdellovibrionota bacterium]|nr:hypothetical protein [Bdellovibrionota bacterium]